MQRYFSRLSPVERRFAVGVLVVLFLVLNVVFIWPRFSDWGQVKLRLATAQDKLVKYQTEFAQTNSYTAQVRNMERETAPVPEEDQAIDLLRTVTDQSLKSEVNLIRNTRASTRTNDQFFLEQVQTFDIQGGEEQLVNFLYNLSAGNSMIRVRDLTVNPELPQRQSLSARVKVVASYQKKAAVRPAAAAATTAAAPPAKSNQR